MFRRSLLPVLMAMVLAACGSAPAAQSPTAAPAAPAATTAPAAPAATAAPAAPAATTASAPTAAPDALSGTVTFWTAYDTVSPEFKTLTTEVIPAFEKLHPNVKIDAQAIPYDDLRKKLLASVAGGEVPDLVRSDIIWVPEFAELGALAKVDELFPDFATLKSTFYAGPLSTNFYKGNYYGLPLDTNTRVIFYNKDVFKAAGIDAPPTTFAEIADVCAKVQALNTPDLYCYAEGGTGAWNLMPLIWSGGGALTDPTFSQSTGYLNNDKAVATATMIQGMLKSGTLSPSILGGGIGTSDALGTGKAAFIIDGPWMPPIFKAQFPDLNYGLAPMPAGDGGSQSVVGGEDIVLMQQSKNKDAALAFMRYMVSEDAQLAMGKTGQMPVLQSLTGNAELPAYFPVFQNQLSAANARTPSPSWPKIDDAFSTTFQEILRGEKDPKAALDAVSGTIDGLLKAGK